MFEESEHMPVQVHGIGPRNPEGMTIDSTTIAAEFLTLPDEVLQNIAVRSGVLGTLALSASARTVNVLCASETVWRQLCAAVWPNRSAAAAAWAQIDTQSIEHSLDSRSCRPADDSWRRMFRQRCIATPGWQVLCPMYDLAIVLAHEPRRCTTWVTNLGFVLLEIDYARAELNLHCDHRGRAQDAEFARVWKAVFALLSSDAQTAQQVEACALSANEGLDEWYALAEAGGGHEHPLLVWAFRTLSALLVLGDGFAQGKHPVGEAIEKGKQVLERSIKSLNEEGCDLSMSAAKRSGLVAQRPGHWWWRLPEPRYVSGGCPLISR